MTPFAALAPYIDAEAASFKTVTDSISSGDRLLNDPVTPSMSTKGSLAVPPLKEPRPLIRKLGLSLPGSDEF